MEALAIVLILFVLSRMMVEMLEDDEGEHK